MSNTALLRSFFSSNESRDLARFVFNALVSDDPEDLDEAVARVNDSDLWPDDLRYELEGLHSFRNFYDEDRMKEYAPEQRVKIEQYDDAWTIEIARRIIGYIPDSLTGRMAPETARRVLGYLPEEWDDMLPETVLPAKDEKDEELALEAEEPESEHAHKPKAEHPPTLEIE